jgi:riboflavin kinase/FMN adenylyltransferase
MTLVKDIAELTSHLDQGSSVTIGNFDGVHVGHQALIRKVIEKSEKTGVKSVIVTFDPHPLRVILGKTPPFITTTEQKLELLSQFTPDHIVCLEFTKHMARLTPEDFVNVYLVQGLHVKELVIGHDYAFGKDRRGDVHLLRELGQRYQFHVEQVDPVYKNNDIVSSTRIRKLIQNGQVWQVRPLLNRFFQITGNVIEGQKRGGPLLGVPTANLKLRDELFPKTGVYAIWAEHDHHIYAGVANVGYNPTFDMHDLSVEAHLFDFHQDIYGQTLTVHFVQRLRDEKKFSGFEELVTQIRKDIASGNELLKQPEASLEFTNFS